MRKTFGIRICLVITVSLLCSFAAMAQQDCPQLYSLVDLNRFQRNAEEAFRQVDLTKFREETEGMFQATPCLYTPLTRNLAASFHRLRGLRFFVDENQEMARLSFAAARSIENTEAFPDDLLPPNHPVRDLWATVSIQQPVNIQVAPPSRGTYYFDGLQGSARPKDWPTVVQQVSRTGRVLGTAILDPADQFPFGSTSNHAARIALFSGAGVSAVASVVFSSVALSLKNDLDTQAQKPTTTASDLTQIYNANHSYVGMAVSTGVLAGLLAVGGTLAN